MKSFLVALLALSVALFAEPADRPALMVVRAGKLFDPQGGRWLDRQTILIEGARVKGVGAEGSVVVPDGIRVVDLSEAWVLPGLIDCHVHLTSDRGGVAAVVAAVAEGLPAHAYEAAVNARKTLEAGFTTVRNLGDAEGVTLALRDAIQNGKLPGPRIVDAGTSISTTSGHMDPTLGFRDELHEELVRHDNLCDGSDDCRKAVRRQIRRGADVIKFATTGGVTSRAGLGLGQQMFEDEARAIVETAHLYGRKVAVHAHGRDGILLALRVGADSIEHGTMLDDECIELFLKTGAYYVPTLSTVNGYIERLQKDPNAYEPAVRAKVDWRIKVTGESVRKAYPRGVRIAFGTDAGISKHGRNADEFELMVKHGMPPAEALKSATVHAADLLGLADEIGSLEVGRKADLIAVLHNPLEDVRVLRSVAVVMKEGVVYKDVRMSESR